jgi:hypothetical protein
LGCSLLLGWVGELAWAWAEEKAVEVVVVVGS